MTASFVLALCLVFIGKPSVSLAEEKKLNPRPTKEFFETLGEIVNLVPLEGKEGYSPDYAYGAAIVFAEDFVKTEEFRNWTLQTDRDDTDVGDTVCYKSEECTLWMPPYVKPFPRK
jgi:hypothetical protein